jgi:small subunit ribosomal protein S20
MLSICSYSATEEVSLAGKTKTIHKSALKRERQARRRRERNRGTLSALKTAVKKVETALAAKEPDRARTLLAEATSALDRAADKKVIPANRAARKISRLSHKLNKAAAPSA